MRALSLAVLAAVSSTAFPASYRLTPLPGESKVRVLLKVEKPAKVFRMPAWAPGDYQVFNYGRFVDAIVFRKDGRSVSSRRGEDDNTWIVPGGATEVEYTVKPNRGNFSENLRVKPNELFVSGPGVFGGFEGHTRERQALTVALVPSGSKAYSTLNRKPAPKNEATFEAKDYDELLDAPLVVGDSVREHSFQVLGKQHRIIAFGSNGDADLRAFADITRRAAETAHGLFGELPYPEYAFFMDFGGMFAGLEHANSARVGLPARIAPEQAASLLFHEYFHAFNVKRIRSKPLGPFDYTRPAVTGALWWLEGVTDYYASVIALRSKTVDPEEFLRRCSGEMSGLMRSDARLRVSADEASRRVWESRGSFGFSGLSYYTKGHVLGIFLDLAIRTQTQGARSLDDVIRRLYNETKGSRPGFSETRIRELCVELGGPELGPLYDLAVLQPGDLPWGRVLPSAGLEWVDGRLRTREDATAGQAAIRTGWLAQ